MKQRSVRNQKELRDGKTRRAKSEKLSTKESSAREQRSLVCKNAKQKALAASVRSKTLTIAIGPAGTGKTFVPTKLAAEALDAKQYKKILLIRPPVETGPKLGALPGEIKDKSAPYAGPFMDALNEHYGSSHLSGKMEGQRPTIEFRVPQYLRGETLHDTFVILDEAQNLTPLQMEMLLTRIGENSVVVVCGDYKQSDQGSKNGLADVVRMFTTLDDRGVRISRDEEVGFVEFTSKDVVRSGFCQKVVQYYEQLVR